MRPIYLDHHATTPCDPRVVADMLPFWSDDFGNASSSTHVFGQRARRAVEKARGEVAELLGVEPRGVVFTSGATEALNLVFKGLFGRDPKRRRVLVAATEHPAVRDCGRWVVRQGGHCDTIPVDGVGRVDVGGLEDMLRSKGHEVALVAVMLANNEVGTIAPMADIGALCDRFEVPLVCDAVQGVGRVPGFSAALPGLVATALSPHKFGGPKGVGVLHLRQRPPILLEALFEGGGQERGLRPGTIAVPLVVGAGTACRILHAEGMAESLRLAALRDHLFARFEAALGSGVVRNSPPDGLAHNLHVSFPGVESRALMARLPHVAFSAGSACHSDAGKVSHVLDAMGLSAERALSAARFGLGRTTTAADIDEAADAIIAAVRDLRRA